MIWGTFISNICILRAQSHWKLSGHHTNLSSNDLACNFLYEIIFWIKTIVGAVEKCPRGSETTGHFRGMPYFHVYQLKSTTWTVKVTFKISNLIQIFVYCTCSKDWLPILNSVRGCMLLLTVRLTLHECKRTINFEFLLVFVLNFSFKTACFLGPFCWSNSTKRLTSHWVEVMFWPWGPVGCRRFCRIELAYFDPSPPTSFQLFSSRNPTQSSSSPRHLIRFLKLKYL